MQNNLNNNNNSIITCKTKALFIFNYLKLQAIKDHKYEDCTNVKKISKILNKFMRIGAKMSSVHCDVLNKNKITLKCYYRMRKR